MAQKDKKKKKLLIFDFETLDLKHTLNDLPNTFSNHYIKSPLYNEYLKKKLNIFEKTYKMLSNDFQKYDQIYKKNYMSGVRLSDIDEKYSKVI